MIALLCAFLAPSSIAYVFKDDIWTCTEDGKNQTRIIRHGRAPAWSPDHRRLCFVRDQSIVVYELATKKERTLWTGPKGNHQVGDPTWGPYYAPERWFDDKPRPLNGGDSILFQPDNMEPKMQQCTSTGKRLSEAPFNLPLAVEVQSPTWSRDGKSLAIAVNGDVWVDFPDETGWVSRRIIPCAEYDFATGRGDMYLVYARHFAWSPDSKQLAYIRERVGGSGTNELWLASIKRDDYGPHLDKTTRISETICHASFTSDGKRIVGETRSGGEEEVRERGISIYDLSTKTWKPIVTGGSEPAG